MTALNLKALCLQKGLNIIKPRDMMNDVCFATDCDSRCENKDIERCSVWIYVLQMLSISSLKCN